MSRERVADRSLTLQVRLIFFQHFCPERPHSTNTIAWEQPSHKHGYMSSTTWDFYAATGDQGLLMYWTKYYKKNVSIIFRTVSGTVKNIGPRPDRDMSVVEKIMRDPFKGVVPNPSICWTNCDRHHPFIDFGHFVASTKPWVLGLPPRFDAERHRDLTPTHHWYATLSDIDRDLKMGIDFKKTFPKRFFTRKNPAHRNSQFEKSRRQLPGFPLTNLLGSISE